VAFASDDASIMLGKNKEVAAKFSKICIYSLIINYCVTYKFTGQKIIYSTHILHISYTYQYLIYVVLYNMNAENPTHIVYT
jgi:hypothetical protein